MGVKTSTAFVPPELAAIIFKPTASLDELKAQLHTQTTLSLQKTLLVQKSDDEDDDTERDLLQVELDKVAEAIKGLRSQISQKKKNQGSSGELLATAKFDVWSFGQVLFEVHRFPILGRKRKGEV